MESMNGSEKRKPPSVLQGDGFYFNHILSRESSVGQSSRMYYGRPEGVPFKWEMQPGTPKNGPEEEVIPPLSPPPSVLSLGLPKPCVDQPKNPDQYSKVWFWRKIKMIHKERKVQTDQTPRGMANVDTENDQRFQFGDHSGNGEFVASFNNSCTSSSSSSNSSKSLNMESSSVRIGESIEGSFSCSPLNISAILDEGDRKVYYCRIHKIAFAVENDGSLVGKIPCRFSSVDQSFRSYYRSSEGIPLKWEMHPGTPKNPPENEMIPPPSPPPAMQSFGLSLPKLHSDEEIPVTTTKGSKISRMWFWIGSKKMQRTENVNGEIRFRHDNDDQESVGSRFGSVSRSSSASSIVVSKKASSIMKLSKLRRDLLGGQHFCFHQRNL
ncbi:hypothetical protein ACH5RR_006320 [Cinchona calisaya]|uniref:Uncharacterized protein n=1 Tax=Cinchona calisaya TaxID=153742 RepID=A0ABD3ANQ1_9GENT